MRTDEKQIREEIAKAILRLDSNSLKKLRIFISGLEAGKTESRGQGEKGMVSGGR